MVLDAAWKDVWKSRRRLVMLLLVWTGCLVALLTWDVAERRRDVDALARTQAMMAVEKDLLYRRWVSDRGGVYAKVGPGLIPNPYLHVPERDLMTPSGQRLTLVNPAYMTRMVHDLGATASGVTGHITSLNPLRPENRPDDWERRALEQLAKGGTSIDTREMRDGRPVFRLMRHLVTEASCLRCHAIQGYKVGESRGGISVAIPLDPILTIAKEQFRDHLRGHAFLWGAGILGILLHERARSRGERERERLLVDVSWREQRFSALFSSVSDALLVLRSGADGTPARVLEANAAAAALLRMPLDTLVGRRMDSFWRSPEASLGREGLFEGEVQVPSGEWIPVECHARAFLFGGEDSRLWVLRDITRRLEESKNLMEAKAAAEAASRAKGQFLAHMSHEIRTPMNAILGYAQLLCRDEGLGARQREQAESIAQSGEHLLDLLNDVLEMSRIEAGRMVLDSVTFDLVHLLDSVESMFRLRCQEKGLDLVFQKAPALPRHVHADQRKIRQVLVNLVGNAVKFTEQGGILVRVDAGSGMSSMCSFLVEVLDSGPGIPEEDAERIFMAFEQTEAGRRKGGTGLGMPISRQFARLLGGNLTVRRRETGGSIFRFTFQAQAGGVLPELPARQIPDLKGAQGRRVLIVDDIPTNRDILRQMLEPSGMECLEAGDGLEALEILRSQMPDLVLLDVVMPRMDGMELLRHLRECHPGLPVIMVSASVLDEQRVQALEAGALGYLQKPFRDLDLFRLVEQAFSECREDPWAAVRAGLHAQSGAWRRALHEAVETGDRAAMRGLLEACGDQELVLTLNRLVERFAYDTLLGLLAREEET